MVRGRKRGPGPRGVEYSPDEIIAAVKEMYFSQGEPVTYHRFAKHCGIPAWQIYQHFRSWYDVREAAGLPRRMASLRNVPADDLLFELHRVVTLIRRWPTFGEYERVCRRNYQLFWRKIGPWSAVEARYREWLNEHPEVADDPAGKRGGNIQIEAFPDRSVAWMRNLWWQSGVGFELRSSDYRGRSAGECDFLVVLNHDWPMCPVPVLVLGELLPYRTEAEIERLRERPE